MTHRVSYIQFLSKIILMIKLTYGFFIFILRDMIFALAHSNTAWKVSKYRVFSGPCFPTFELNTERYAVFEHFSSSANNLNFHYKPNPDKSNDQIFQTCFKNYIFAPFGLLLPILRQIGLFFWKICSEQFFSNKGRYYCAKFQEKMMRFWWKLLMQADQLTDLQGDQDKYITSSYYWGQLIRN